MRNTPNESSNPNINPVLQSVISKGYIEAPDAQALLQAYEANKTKTLIYTQSNLDLFRKMLKIETNDRFFGSPDIMLLRTIVKSQIEGVLDDTSPENMAQAAKSKTHTPWREKGLDSHLALQGSGEWSSIRLGVQDLKNLAKMVKAEAGGEPEEGQDAVLNVIFNRVLDGRFGKGVQGVLFQKGQFSPVSDGRFQIASLDKTIIANIADFLKQGKNFLDEALFFQVNGIKNGWINRTQRKITTIGNHSFFGPKEQVASRKKQNDDARMA